MANKAKKRIRENGLLAVLFLLLISTAMAILFPINLTLFVLDGTAPEITIDRLGPTSSTNINVTGTFNEDNELDNITVDVNGTHIVKAVFNATTSKWNASINLTEGWNRFYVLAYDSAGNFANRTSSSQEASILLDTISPSINLTAPNNNTEVANNSLISFVITDLALADAFYTINDGATTSFGSVFEIIAGSTEWVDGENYIVINATDHVNNAARKNYTFSYSNQIEVLVDSSVAVVNLEVNTTNQTLNKLQNESELLAIIEESPAEIDITDYNETIQTLNILANLSSAITAIQSLEQEILDVNSSAEDNSTKIANISAKLDEIRVIKNNTIKSVTVNQFDPNLTVNVDNTTTSNVTNELLSAVTGLSSSDQDNFKVLSEALRNKTTVVNKVQRLTKTFLNGRTQNITLYKINVTINETQSGDFYINAFIDKNITGDNDLNASVHIVNKISQPLTVIVEDPIVRWTFSDTASTTIKYAIEKNIPPSKTTSNKIVLTTVPSKSSSTSASGAGGGGGGGVAGEASEASSQGAPLGITTAAKDIRISVDKEFIKLVLKQTEEKVETVIIKNTGKDTAEIGIILNKAEDFISQESLEKLKQTIKLLPGEEKALDIIFTAKKTAKPDVYPFEIIFRAAGFQKRLTGIIEVESIKPLFDISVEIPATYKRISPGDKLLMDVKVFNLRGFGRVDVGVEYSIKDFSGNVIVSGHETIAVETQVNFVRELVVPTDLKPGTYIASAKVSFEGITGTASEIFDISVKTIEFGSIKLQSGTLNLLLIFILLLFIVFVALIYEYGFRYSKRIKPVVEYTKQRRKDRSAEKIKSRIRRVEKAYYSGALSKETYERIRTNLKEKLKRTKNRGL